LTVNTGPIFTQPAQPAQPTAAIPAPEPAIIVENPTGVQPTQPAPVPVTETLSM
jgi:hypothetical protein